MSLVNDWAWQLQTSENLDRQWELEVWACKGLIFSNHLITSYEWLGVYNQESKRLVEQITVLLVSISVVFSSGWSVENSVPGFVQRHGRHTRKSRSVCYVQSFTRGDEVSALCIIAFIWGSSTSEYSVINDHILTICVGLEVTFLLLLEFCHSSL